MIGKTSTEAGTNASGTGSAHQNGRWPALAAVVAVMSVGGWLRLWALGSIGFNSDEAVYTGQAAGLAGDPVLKTLFPVFRAHPLLFQVVLSLVLRTGTSDTKARVVAVAFGLATILVTYLLGRLLYSRPVGLVAAGIVAVMPYCVVVSRQVLLDGPMAFFATASLYCLARFCRDRDERWLFAGAGVMGLTVLTKETAVLLVFGVLEFFFLVRNRRPRWRDGLVAAAIFSAVVAVYALTLAVAGRLHTGEQYLLWQGARPPNHPYDFYAQVLPPAVGWGVLALAVWALVWTFWRWGWSGTLLHGWSELLLTLWVLVPALFFSFVLGVKGYQYLEFAGPPLALLAAVALVQVNVPGLPQGSRRRLLAGGLATVLLTGSLAWQSWQLINPQPTTSFLAGSGGLPGGRETGQWVESHVPIGGQLLTIGPSLANVIQYYGHRRVLALSVSPNPLGRNPSYEPVVNPDYQLRQGNFQYLVWDAYSAHRSPNFAAKLLGYVHKYRAVAVYTQTVKLRGATGQFTDAPVIVIYEVRIS